MNYKATIIRKEHFNAAHRLHNEAWSAEKNTMVFGKCNSPNFHGHNYILEVRVTGEIDLETGFVMDSKQLKSFVKEEVIDRYDHKNLNLDVEDFENINPTAENIAQVIYKRLKKVIKAEYQLKIKLYETERNIVEYPG